MPTRSGLDWSLEGCVDAWLLTRGNTSSATSRVKVAALGDWRNAEIPSLPQVIALWIFIWKGVASCQAHLPAWQTL